MSDFSGNYSLSLGAGTYALAVSKTGFRRVSRTLQLALGENRAAAFDTLFASVGRLSGRVLSDGSAVAGALVTLAGLSPEAGGGAFTTDTDGRFSRDGLPAGTYGLTAGADGFTEGRIASLTVTAGGAANVEISLIANRGVLAGTARQDGAVAADVPVTASAYGISRSSVSAADGKYRIEKLPAGVYSVSISRAGFTPDKAYEAQSLTANGSLAGLDFNLLKNAGSLSGIVSGAASASGIRISAVGRKGARAYAVCDGSGKFAMASIPADFYTLSVAAPGYKLAGASQAPEITVTGSTQYNPVLVPAVFRLSGRILDQSGTGLAGLPVELRHRRGSSGRGQRRGWTLRLHRCTRRTGIPIGRKASHGRLRCQGHVFRPGPFRSGPNHGRPAYLVPACIHRRDPVSGRRSRGRRVGHGLRERERHFFIKPAFRGVQGHGHRRRGRSPENDRVQARSQQRGYGLRP